MDLVMLEAEPDPLVVDELKRLLALAERGEIVGIAYVVNWRQHNTEHGFVRGDSSISALVTGVQRLNLALLGYNGD